MKLPKLFDTEIQKKMLHNFLRRDAPILQLAEFLEDDVVPRAVKRGEPIIDYLRYAKDDLEEVAKLTHRFDGIEDAQERRSSIRSYLEHLHSDGTGDAEWLPMESIQAKLYVLTYFVAIFRDLPTSDYSPDS